MKKLHSKKINKIIMMLLAIIMLCNFIMPKISIAADTEDGGSDVDAITDFFCFLADAINDMLQTMFIAPYEIEKNNSYMIFYSPGIIFANMVPALNANFFNPIPDLDIIVNDDDDLDKDAFELMASGYEYDGFTTHIAPTAAQKIAASQCDFMSEGNLDQNVLNQIENEFADEDEFWERGADDNYPEGYYIMKINGVEILYSTHYYMDNPPGHEASIRYDIGNDNGDYEAYIEKYDKQQAIAEFKQIIIQRLAPSDFSSSDEQAILDEIIGAYSKLQTGLEYRDSGNRARVLFTYKHNCNNKYTAIAVERGSESEIAAGQHEWYIYCMKNSDNEDSLDEKSPVMAQGGNTISDFTTVANQAKKYISNNICTDSNGDADEIYNLLMNYYNNEVQGKSQEDIETEKRIEFTHSCDKYDDEESTIIVHFFGETNAGNAWGIYLVSGDKSELLYNILAGNRGYHKYYPSTARILQPIIATWYKALRRIALVGLLSALLYIGIKITLTSTSAENKAKYKKMFKDWLVALCLLFALHYLMTFMTMCVDEINSIIGKSVVGANGQDKLMTTLRNEIANGKTSAVVAKIVIYNVITVFTIIFTVQYIRRLIYLAFFTMIAPLVTLTYPLDKLKDSKAQALDMWLKDYIFFYLLQVIHLLLYYIFVQSSMELADSGSWIMALIAIGFLTKAEKIVKSMFGFDKSKSMGSIGAAASGAFVTNLVSKLNHPPKLKGKSGADDSQEGGAKPVRTVQNNPQVGASNGTSTSQPTTRTYEGNTNNPNSSSRGTNNTPGVASEGQTPGDGAGNEAHASAFEAQTGGNEQVSSAPRRNINNNASTRYRRYSGIASRVLRTATGLAGGAIGGAAGLAIGIAQGDIDKALLGITTGATAGYYTGQKLELGAERTSKRSRRISKCNNTFWTKCSTKIWTK